MNYKVTETYAPRSYKYEEQEAQRAPERYRKMKEKVQNAVILFRCGDFYEAYCDDADICAKVLGITLTSNSAHHYRMAGFPYHALDIYLPRLIHAGHRIAICEPE